LTTGDTIEFNKFLCQTKTESAAFLHMHQKEPTKLKNILPEIFILIINTR